MEALLIKFLNQLFGVPNVGDTPQNKGQCVGLIEVWLDILGKNSPHLWGNAKDLLDAAKGQPDKFVVTYNDPNNYNQFPKPGAVLVFGSSFGGGLGHTGCILRANGYGFTLFEQNNPTGSRPTITNYHSYAGVEGWFEVK